MAWLEWIISHSLLRIAESNPQGMDEFWITQGALLLLTLTQSSQDDVQEKAATGLATFVVIDDGNATIDCKRAEAVMKGGGVRLLLGLATSWREGLQSEAAKALANLSVNTCVAKAVAEEGGITILAKLAKSMNKLVAEEAAGGLWNLSVGEEHKGAIAEAGSIKSLVDLIFKWSNSGDGVLERAAGALANLAADDKCSMEIAVTGGVHALVMLARNCKFEGVQEQAARALANLAAHGENDMMLRSLSAFKNLQILKLVGCVNGLYGSVVSDIGLTILAQGCRRLLKLELNGCEGSYDGIKAIGQCCQMLEELTICNHRMDGGWLSALSFCENLKTLKLQSCDEIDSSPGADEHLGAFPTLEELYLERCQVRDQQSLKALFLVCESVRAISFHDCWGLEDEAFRLASICRRVKSLSLEGCSSLTVEGLDSVVQTWKELEVLKVVSCNSIKAGEITPSLAILFSDLKELKWRPDTKSLLSSSLSGTGVGKKGGKFFKRMVNVMDKRR